MPRTEVIDVLTTARDTLDRQPVPITGRIALFTTERGTFEWCDLTPDERRRIAEKYGMGV